MDPGDIEGLAESAYVEARLEPEAGPVALARTLFGASAVEIVPKGALRFSGAALAKVRGEWRIYVRRDEPHVMRFAVGHELAHYVIRRAGAGLTDDEERKADMLGAALVAPRRAFLSALRAVGPNLPDLAAAFVATESLVALRRGEVTSLPTALVRPGLVRVRSQPEFVWPDEGTIKRWAAGRPPRGLGKVRLRDDPRRVVLTGDDAEAG